MPIDNHSKWHQMGLDGYYALLTAAIDNKEFEPQSLVNSYGATVWHMMAKTGHYKKLVWAIRDGRFIVSELRNTKGATVCHYLAHGGFYAELRLGLDDGIFKAEDLVTYTGANVYHYFAIGGHLKPILQALNAKYFDADACLDKHGLSVWNFFTFNDNADALLMAFYHGHLSLEKLTKTCIAAAKKNEKINGLRLRFSQLLNVDNFEVNLQTVKPDFVWFYVECKRVPASECLIEFLNKLYCEMAAVDQQQLQQAKTDVTQLLAEDGVDSHVFKYIIDMDYLSLCELLKNAHDNLMLTNIKHLFFVNAISLHLRCVAVNLELEQVDDLSLLSISSIRILLPHKDKIGNFDFIWGSAVVDFITSRQEDNNEDILLAWRSELQARSEKTEELKENTESGNLKKPRLRL